MFFMVAALSAATCKEQPNDTDVQQQVPKFKSCTISPEDYVTTELNKISITYTLPISVADEDKIALVDNINNKIDISVAARNLSLNITLNDTITYNQKYTLTIAAGAIQGANGGKLVTETYTVSFLTEERILPVDEFDIDPKLTHPNPSSQAVELYDYFKSIFGKYTVSGAMAKYTVQLNEAEWMNTHTGKYPAIACFDLMNATRPDYTSWGDPPYSEMITNAKQWYADGGLISIMWHWRDPLRENDAFYSMKTNNNPRTDFDVSKVHDKASPEYKAMIKDIDFIADYLKQLQQDGIPVLWRPLHEAQGGWFWWGAQQADDCVALWRLMYDRLHNHHQLNNLIWVWTITNMEDAEDWYPGHDVVDIVGADVYRNNPNHQSYIDYFDFVASVSEGRKMVALSECGPVPRVEQMQEKGDKWLYFMPWYGDYTQSDTSNGVQYLSALFNTEFVLTRDEMP